MTIVAALITAAALSGTAAVPADTVRTDTLRAAEVVARGVRPEAEAAAPVQRISVQSVRRMGVTDTGDALRRMAGTLVRDYGGAGGLKTVSVRGLGPTHTAVTYDGLPVSDAQTGLVDLQRYPLDRLAAIGLETGDAPSLAVPARQARAAATVVLSTDLPATPDGRLHGRAALRQASWTTWAPSLSLARRVGQGSVVGLSADYFFALNDYPFRVVNGVATADLRRTNSRMQGVGAEANWRHLTPGGDRLEGKASFTHSHRRLPGQVVLYVNDNDERLTDREGFAQLRWHRQRGPWEVNAAARYDRRASLYADVDAQYPGGRLDQNYRQGEAYATIAAARTLGGGWTLASATDYAIATLRSNLKVDRRVARHALTEALSLRWQSGRWQLTGRGIWQWGNDHVSGPSASAARRLSRITPSLTASVLAVGGPVRLRLRALAKQTVRRPTMDESYRYHLGSTTLRPERALQSGAGFTLDAAPARWWPQLTLTLDGYLNRVSDRIVSVPRTLQVWQTVNIGSVAARGLDLTLQSRFAPAAGHALILAANHSLQRAYSRREQTGVARGTQLPYTPRGCGSASLAWESPWANLAIHATYASTRWTTLQHLPTTRLEGYAEWGITLYRTLRLRRAEADLRADLANASDCRYEVVRRYPMPGRAYSISLAVRW